MTMSLYMLVSIADRPQTTDNKSVTMDYKSVTMAIDFPSPQGLRYQFWTYVDCLI